MMTDILSTNTTAVARLLALFRVQLATLEAALVSRDTEQLQAILTSAHDARRHWAEEHLK